MIFLYWEWHLIPRWLLRSIFALLSGCFKGFVQPVLEYCPAVWCSAADTHHKLLDRVVSGASFFTGGVFECDLEHRRSMAVLCILYKIRCDPLHAVYGALPIPHVPVLVTRNAIAHRYTYAPPIAAEPRSIAGLLFPCQYLCGTILMTPYSMVWDSGFQEHGQCLSIGLAARSLFVSCCFFFLFVHSICWYSGAGVIILIGW